MSAEYQILDEACWQFAVRARRLGNNINIEITPAGDVTIWGGEGGLQLASVSRLQHELPLPSELLRAADVGEVMK